MRSRVKQNTEQSSQRVPSGARRRGSALVIVVGTLALIAVIAAFYVTLGQSDTRVSRGVEQGGAIADVERQAAEHIMGVIGADRLAVEIETVSDDEDLIGDRWINGVEVQARAVDRQRFVREATDFPYTDFTKLSIITDETGDGLFAYDPSLYFGSQPIALSSATDAVEKMRFRPAGDETTMLDLLDEIDSGSFIGLDDRRTASDPWLSVLEPTFTGRLAFSFGAPVGHDARSYSSRAAQLSGRPQSELYYLDNRDLAQISNVAPDGLFVSLFNLRNNFGAESGLGLDANRRPRMSENRTLLTIDPATLELRATDKLHIDPLGALVSSILDYTPEAFAIKNTPAWWTMNQRFMHFPADPSFQIRGRDVDADGIPNNGAFTMLQTPGMPDFPDHQYADADGDRFYDSRWMELTDSTLGPSGVQNLIANETDMRLFFAVKIVDLSGKVNVNSATDSLAPATSLVQAGATPAEIDLRRILTMQDQAEKYAPAFNAGRLSYAHIERLPSNERQANNTGSLVAADYEAYGADFLSVPPFTLDAGASVGLRTGRFAYDALRRAIQGDRAGLHPESTSVRTPYPGQELLDISTFEYYSFDPDYNSTAFGSRILFQTGTPSYEDIQRMARNRRDYWYNAGGSNIADPGDAPITADGFGANLFGIEDLAELLVFHGVNDDSSLSTLERVLQGRYDNGSASPGSSTIQFGPLRSTRPTALERRHDNWTNSVNPTVSSSASDNQIDHESMALTALNPRLRLTTLSGASPIRRRVLQDPNGDGILSASERRLTSEDARLDLTGNPSPRELFALYTDALMPYAYVDSTWYADPEAALPPFGSEVSLLEFNQMRTLSYGHRGSELAMRLSAHLALNMADMLDADDTPSVATVLTAPVSNSGTDPRQLLDPDMGGQLASLPGEDFPYPWWTGDGAFDLGNDKLAPDTAEVANTGLGNDFARTAYNAYGLEPQPFITEVSVVTVYSDVPRGAATLTSGSGGFNDPLLMGFENDDRESPPANFGDALPDPQPASFEDRASPGLFNGTIIGTGCDPMAFGYETGPADDVNLRVDTSGDNPDLMLHVLAVQLTNPFDVAINLTDDEDAYVEDPNNADRMIPNRGFLDAMGSNVSLEQAKYYFEFNGHFFPLVEYIENFENRDSNRYVDGNSTSSQTGLYRIILEPGESRVVYVSAHASLDNLTERWKQLEEVYRNQLGDQAQIDESPRYLETAPLSYVQNYLDDHFAVRGSVSDVNPFDGDDVNYPARVVPFDPTTGTVLESGSNGRFVEFLRTNGAYRDIGAAASPNEVSRMRQEVRLWRMLTVAESNEIPDFEQSELTGSPDDNWIGNDMLVDRLRDPAVADRFDVTTEATLDYATMDSTKMRQRDYITDVDERYDPFAANNTFWDSNGAKTLIPIALTMSTDDTSGLWSYWGGTNQGLTIAMRAGFRRPDHLEEPTEDGLLGEDGLAVRGLLPAWCIEGIEKNHNIAQPSEVDAMDGFAGPQEIVNSIDTANNDQFGEFFGFRGCHGNQSFANPRDGARGGMFYMNFLRFVKDTKPVRDELGFPEPSMTRVQSQGYNGSGTTFVASSATNVENPMLVPTITRHPAVKFRQNELVNELPDPDGDGIPNEYIDGLEFAEMLENRILPALPIEIEPSGKRTIARLGTDSTLTDAEIIATVPTLLTMGRDGLGDTPDPRDMTVRLGDLALPFAIGATFAPRSPGTVLPRNFQIGEWTTFAEAMSAALGYEPPSFYTGTQPGDLDYTLLSELIEAKGTRNSPASPDTLFDSTVNYQRLYVLDQGRLDLQAFSPFVNRSGSTAVAPQFTPGSPGFGDYRVGFSEPPAQRLLSMGQAISRGGNPLTTPVIGTVNINTASDAVLRAIPGFATSLQFSENGLLYNRYQNAADGIFPALTALNAPLMEWGPGRVAGKTTAAFRAIPPVAGQEFKPALGVGDPFGSYTTQGFFVTDGWKHTGELTSSLVAFRDRTRAEFRQAAKNGGPGGAPPPLGGTIDPDTVFDFTPTLTLAGGPISPIFAPDILELTVGNFANDFSRSSINGQWGATEKPGLTGTGSLLGISVAKTDPLASIPGDIVNQRLLTNSGGPAIEPKWRPSVIDGTSQGTIDRFGTDGYAMASLDQDWNGQDDPGFDGNPSMLFDDEDPDLPVAEDNFSYTLGRAGFYNENPSIGTRTRSLEDEVLDDALEELAIFNGAANTIDVRSDFYAAWYIIRGYRQDDVESLDPDEPMRPSYQKRFLMILDRSNVTDAGQLPKVLLIREVPL